MKITEFLSYVEELKRVALFACEKMLTVLACDAGRGYIIQ